jgi:hypothetical protein
MKKAKAAAAKRVVVRPAAVVKPVVSVPVSNNSR